MNDDATPAPARAPVDLIPQPHGGAIRPPWTRGTGAAAARSSVRAIRKESLSLLAEATPEAAARLVALMRSTDERVATIAATAILDRVHGKASDKPAEDDAASQLLDLSHVSADEMREAWDAIDTLIRLCGPPGR